MILKPSLVAVYNLLPKLPTACQRAFNVSLKIRKTIAQPLMIFSLVVDAK
jgi:hypothetical protein